MSELPIYILDAFTNVLFKGNPAAVCPLKNWLPDQVMQSIANENNLAETAFFVADEDHFKLRWFTPTQEVELCGHATLASAYVIFEILKYKQDKIIFLTQSGLIEVTRHPIGYQMNFPGREVTSCQPTQELLSNFSKQPKEILRSGNGTYIVVLENEIEVRNFKPDFLKLAQVDRAVNITAPGDNCDFVSRFFGPHIGIPEDSVTGSAHCGLAIYWSKKLKRSDELHAIQLSERTGEIFCQVKEDRVLLSGSVKLYSQGHIFLN